MKSILRQQIAFRCPECAMANVGFLGGLHNVSDMLRLRCECDKLSLEIKPHGEGKIHISVPCVYCKDSHSYVVSRELLARDIPTALPCPHTHHDILFVADESAMPKELERSANELSAVLTSFDADDVKDIQPMDLDEEDAPPDPAIYDVLNFVIRDLEESGGIECPCKKGPYELRFTNDGAEVSCGSCGASYRFYARSSASAESYLSIDSIKLG